jgi:Superinfection immunity protein
MPALAASARRHRNRAAIFVLNLLLGWTALGWIVALVWAFTKNVEMPPPADAT